MVLACELPGVWDGLEAVGLAYEEICEPRWFDEARHWGVEAQAQMAQGW